jgi:hypothetical protein
MTAGFLTKNGPLGQAAELLDLASEAEAITALFNTAKSWPALKAQLTGINDGTSLRQWLDQAKATINEPAIKAAFKSAGLASSHAGIVKFVGKWNGQIDKLAQSQWAKLFNRLDLYAESKEQPDVGLVRWTPFNYKVAADGGQAPTVFHF